MNLSNNQLPGRLVVTGNWILLGAGAIFFGIMVYLLYLRGRIADASFFEALSLQSEAEAMSNVMLVSMFSVLGLSLGMWILFMVWHFRAYRNLKRLGLNIRYWLGWAILSWVIPVAGYFLPYLLIRDQIQRSMELLEFFRGEGEKEEFPAVLGMATFWWILYVVILIGINIMARMVDGNESAGVTMLILMGIGAMAISLLGALIGKQMSELDMAVYHLWESGRIDEYKAARYQEANKDKVEQAPDWYAEEGQPLVYQPQGNVFADQDQTEAEGVDASGSGSEVVLPPAVLQEPELGEASAEIPPAIPSMEQEGASGDSSVSDLQEESGDPFPESKD